jgi:hypothetical protein
MMANVNQGKGVVFDCVADFWFRVGMDTDCKKLQRERPD